MNQEAVKSITDEEMLDELLSTPRQELVELMKRLEGDITIIGVAGKMGVTLGRMAKRAVDAAGVKKRICGVDVFGDDIARKNLEKMGIETVKCDLLDREAVAKLPKTSNVIYMAGKKFGTDGSEDLTWAMNTVVPAYVAEHFKKSSIVVFSTGCVYPLVPVETCGCTEKIMPSPVGDYAQSCLGRERIFTYFSKTNKTPVLLFRLNYAVDLRYGVLYDIGSKIWADEPVTASVQHFNVVWQGDANNYALLSLDLCRNPLEILNVTGPETIPLSHIAEEFGRIFKKAAKYTGTHGNIAYLNNAAKAFKLFGYPKVSLNQMIQWQADWIMKGGKSLGKPTHFEVNNGKF
jgi:nucleoside-diphosphate-sugar epimerase